MYIHSKNLGTSQPTQWDTEKTKRLVIVGIRHVYVHILSCSYFTKTFAKFFIKSKTQYLF